MLRTLLLLLGLATAAPSIASDQPHRTPDGERAGLAADRGAEVRAQAWSSYCGELEQVLARSTSARDWALATLLPGAQVELGAKGCRTDGDKLLKRAAEAAPDDAMVQWIAAHARDLDPRIAQAAEQRLKALEPENAPVWFGDLSGATRRHDAAGVDEAMRHIGASSRYDEHFVQVFGGLIDVFQRYPVPDALLAVADAEERSAGRDGIAYSLALTATVTISLSSFQDLMAACRVDTDTGDNATHAPDCASVARLMVRETDSVLANRIGYAVLRVSRTYSKEDQHAARVDDWVYSQAQHLMNSDKDDAAGAEIRAFINDWLDTRSELQAMRRKLLRNGLAAEPPADWEDDNSPFSAKRLQQDEELRRKHRGG